MVEVGVLLLSLFLASSGHVKLCVTTWKRVVLVPIASLGRVLGYILEVCTTNLCAVQINVRSLNWQVIVKE